MTTLLPPDLARLGDDLERAIAGQLAQTTDNLTQLPARRDVRRLVRTTRRRVLVVGAGAVLAIGGAVGAAASGLVGPHEVEVALPGSAAIFSGFTPVCQALENGDEFRCTVDGAASRKAFRRTATPTATSAS